ncbi:gp53-like domain-containing protein [Erwinia sp. CGal63]|uniref:gp53-like domain-containing protein n=1 Tax=Erwinia sp. CGal63 TaxID=2919889 RepID=UPI00300B7F8D
MAKNDFKPFATGEEANVLSQEEFEKLDAVEKGFESGIARSEQLNKVWRQASTIASVVASFMADKSGNDVLDNGDTAALQATLLKALLNNSTSQLDNRYLQSGKNLADLGSAAQARTNLGLGSLAQKNGLSAADVGAFPAAGGTVGAQGVKAPGIFVNNHTMPGNSQGMYMLWNESNGTGEGSLVCNRGTGSGGFVLRTVNSDNTVETGRVTINGNGDLNSSRYLMEMGQRAYSPNNPPSQFNAGGWFKDVATGFIIQWGNTSNGSSNIENHNYNIAFPHAALVITGSLGAHQDLGRVVYMETLNNSVFSSRTTTNGLGFYWMAIGY